MGDGSLATPSKTSFSNRRQSMGSEAGIRQVINIVDDKMLIFDPPDAHLPRARTNRVAYGSNTKRVREHRFVFDRLFDNTATQNEVYANTTRPLLDSILDGYNATVFAYGATGCGKTHTITGTTTEPGIIFLTMKELFERIDELKDTKHVELSLSYLEIYNETIRDLLDRDHKKTLVLREDAVKHVSVSNLSIHSPQNVQEVMEMIITGNENRTMSATEANAASSRSHAVLQVNVSQKSRTASLSEAHTFATLSIIDLAGSERASATKNRGERLIEGANINKSLLALGNCINALCDPHRRNHVPYRDSKLTRLLKFSLGGNCKTVMIVCVSPSSKHYDETLNTLKYADRAKKIKTKVIRNEHNLNRHVGSYLKMINDQKQEIEELRAREGKAVNAGIEQLKKVDADCYVAINNALAKLRQTITEVQQQRETRILATIKTKALTTQIFQIESVLKSYLSFHFSTAGSESIPLETIIRQNVNKLSAERSQLNTYLASLEVGALDLNGAPLTPTNFGGSSSDKSVVKQRISHLLCVLKDTRGWSPTHCDAFKNQAELMRVQMELEVANRVVEESASSPDNFTAIEIISKNFFKLLQHLSTLGQESFELNENKKYLEITTFCEGIVQEVRQYFENCLSNTNALLFSDLSDSSISTGSTSFSTPTWSPKAVQPTKQNTLQRHASVSSLQNGSPASSRSIRRSSLGNPTRLSDGNSGGIPSLAINPRPLLPRNNSRLTKKPDFPITNQTASLSSNRPSSRNSPFKSPVSKKLGIHPNGFSSTSSLSAPKSTTVPETKNLNTRSSLSSNLKTERKAVKRVRWDDDTENGKEDSEEKEEDSHESCSSDPDSTSNTDIMPSQLARLGLNGVNEAPASGEPSNMGNTSKVTSSQPAAEINFSNPSKGLPNFAKTTLSAANFITQPPRRKNLASGAKLSGSTFASRNSRGIGLVPAPRYMGSSSTKSIVARTYNRSVACPVDKSQVGQVLFDNDPLLESDASNEPEEANEQTNLGKDPLFDIEANGSKMSIDFPDNNNTETDNTNNAFASEMSLDLIPEPPKLSSDSSTASGALGDSSNVDTQNNDENMDEQKGASSLEPMDLDDDNTSTVTAVPSSTALPELNRFTSNASKPNDFETHNSNPSTATASVKTNHTGQVKSTPVSAQSNNKPRLSFGVNGSLRRKSSLLPLASSPSSVSSPAPVSALASASAPSLLLKNDSSSTANSKKSQNIDQHQDSINSKSAASTTGRAGLVSSVVSNFENSLFEGNGNQQQQQRLSMKPQLKGINSPSIENKVTPKPRFGIPVPGVSGSSSLLPAQHGAVDITGLPGNEGRSNINNNNTNNAKLSAE